MSQRDRATGRMGNARVDHWEARYFTKGTARSTKAAAKREMTKARRALAAVEVRDADA